MIDEITLQRLVDGELDDTQIRQLLHQAEHGQHSLQTWKQLAVAYVENQMLQNSLQAFDNAVDNAIDPAKTSADAGEVQPSFRSSDVRAKHTATPVGRFSPRSVWVPMAIAACLLIALGVGLNQLASTKFFTHSTHLATAGSTIAGQSQATDAPIESRVTPDDVHDFNRQSLMALKPDRYLQSDQLPTGISQSSRQQIPMYNMRRFAPQQLSGLRSHDASSRQALFAQIMPGDPINDQLKSDYQNAGLMVDQEIEILSGHLDDGRSYMIPYRSVRFLAGQ